jgi:hypothetical protein
MKSLRSLIIIPAAVMACGIALGCSYHKTVETTEPAPATVVEPAPVVAVPPVTSSTTTTTTDTAPAVIEQQKTTTYTTTP